MTHPPVVTNARQRVEQMQHLIEEASRERAAAEPLADTVPDEIDRTRRMSTMMENLAYLITSMDEQATLAKLPSPTSRAPSTWRKVVTPPTGTPIAPLPDGCQQSSFDSHVSPT